MKAIFLTPEQLFGSAERPDAALPLFSAVGTVAPPTDLALLTIEDDGFAFEPGGGINCYLAQDSVADRFGRLSTPGVCPSCAVRPALLLEPGEESLLRNLRTDGSVTTAEYGLYPAAILDRSLRDLAEKNLRDHSLLLGDLCRAGGITEVAAAHRASPILDVAVCLAGGGNRCPGRPTSRCSR